MYKSFTANDLRKHFILDSSYTVEGFLVYGTFKKYPYEQLKKSLERIGVNAIYMNPKDEFLQSILEFHVNGKRYWFVTAYGGALLSEYLHLACLFGSKKNILLGSCGGLKKGSSSMEMIIPNSSYAEESAARAYQPESGNIYKPDEALSRRLAGMLAEKHSVLRGETITYQAMLGETWEDVQNWESQGYVGVEMEAATVFSVSNHFNVPSAAILQIGDNLIEEKTVLDINYESSRDLRRKVSEDMFGVALQELIQF